MKDFDINLARKGHPVCTRDGKPVRIMCFDLKAENDRNILALIDKGPYETIGCYHRNGHLLSYNTQDDADLMMASVKHEGWVNIYWGNNGIFVPGAFVRDSKEEAKKDTIGREKNLIATAKIEWEE